MNASQLTARRVTVLTGATGGIGEQTARHLAATGDELILVARQSRALQSLAAAIEKDHGRCPEIVAADIATGAGRARVAQTAIRAGANTLINNAAQPCFGALDELDDALIESVLQTNLLAPILLTRALLPHLRRAPSATILNIGSTLGAIGLPGFSVYGASKAGLQKFTEALRRELNGETVRVCHLAPRATRTAFNDQRVEQYNQASGAGSDSPEVVARAVCAMLESGRAERFLGRPEALGARLNLLLSRWMDPVFRGHRKALLDGRPERLPLPSTSEALVQNAGS